MRSSVLIGLLCLASPALAYAQGAAPALYGVHEVLINYAHFDNPEMSDRCGLSRELVASVLEKSFASTTVPTMGALDAKPQLIGVARIGLNPEISSYLNDSSLDCISVISLTATSKVGLMIPPVTTARNVTVVYWQQNIMVVSGETVHTQKVTEGLQKLAAQFAQEYKIDQPPEPGKK